MQRAADWETFACLESLSEGSLVGCEHNEILESSDTAYDVVRL